MGKTYKDSKYRPENQHKKDMPGKKSEKRLTKKKARTATKKELRSYE